MCGVAVLHMLGIICSQIGVAPRGTRRQPTSIGRMLCITRSAFGSAMVRTNN